MKNATTGKNTIQVHLSKESYMGYYGPDHGSPFFLHEENFSLKTLAEKIADGFVAFFQHVHVIGFPRSRSLQVSRITYFPIQRSLDVSLDKRLI